MHGSEGGTSTPSTPDDGPADHDDTRGLILTINDLVTTYVMRTATSASDREATTNEIAALVHDDLMILASGWVDPPTT